MISRRRYEQSEPFVAGSLQMRVTQSMSVDLIRLDASTGAGISVLKS